MVDITGLDKAAVLAALYNASKPQGMGFLRFDPTPMTVEEARTLLGSSTSFDYLRGRVLKVHLGGDTFGPTGYDCDNGQGAAQRVVDSLRSTGDPNNIMVRATHAAATSRSADSLEPHLEEPDEVYDVGDFRVFKMGVSANATQLRRALRRARKRVQSPLE